MAHRVASLSCVAILLSLLISFTPMATSSLSHHHCEPEPDKCDYIVTVLTGAEGSDDSRIELKLSDAFSNSFTVLDLKDYGSETDGHVYFKTGGEDHFHLKKFPCLDVCAITVTFDENDESSSWGLKYVGIKTDGKIKYTKSYTVDKVLSKEDECTLKANVEKCPGVSLWPSFYCL